MRVCSFQRTAVRLALLAVYALLAGGCEGPKYPSITLSGRVTIDGAGVPEGYITFSPAATTAGPVVGTSVANGDYLCEQVPLGMVQVTFVAHAAEPMTIVHKADNVPHEVPRDILPVSYRQGVAVEIVSGENRRDFDLKNSR